MSKTNSAVLWLEAEIVRLKRELVEYELARNIMTRFEELPRTKTEVVAGYLTMEEHASATIAEKRAMAKLIAPTIGHNSKAMVGPHSVLPAGAGNRADMIVRLLRAGPLTSGMLIERLGCKTKQDKQMIYAALNTMKREKIITQYEDSRRYKLS